MRFRRQSERTSTLRLSGEHFNANQSMSAGKIISEADTKRVDDARTALMEHFDSVRIFVTRHDGSEANTACYETGGGNFYAQLGQVTEWLAIQDQFQREHAKKKANQQ